MFCFNFADLVFHVSQMLLVSCCILFEVSLVTFFDLCQFVIFLLEHRFEFVLLAFFLLRHLLYFHGHCICLGSSLVDLLSGCGGGSGFCKPGQKICGDIVVGRVGPLGDLSFWSWPALCSLPLLSSPPRNSWSKCGVPKINLWCAQS